MYKLLLVGIGGFIGSLSRYLVSGWVYQLFPERALPYGTLTVNVLGSLFIGILVALSETRYLFIGSNLRLLILVGILGGFTTFSTFSYETLSLFKDAEILRALINIALNVTMCLVAVWLGYALPHVIYGK